MLVGFSGRLVSEDFLERRLFGTAADSREMLRLRPRLVEWRRRCQTLGPASALRTILEVGAAPLLHALGFTAASSFQPVRHGVAAVARAGATPVSLVVGSWGEPLDPLWRPAIEHAARVGASWCLLFNGPEIRLVDAQRLYTRRHAQFDIDAAIDDSKSLAALALLLQARMLAGGRDRRTTGLVELIAASDRHAAGVCTALRNGVFEASTELAGALLAGPRAPRVDDAFEQALTLVYRVLFLFFAEARSLVPVWHPVYRESYSLESLCRDLTERPRPAVGVWDALRAISRLAHSGCRIADLNVTAFNGRLFSPAQTPLAERQGLSEAAAGRALVALSRRPAQDRQATEPIAYRDLGVEELGGVYETLLGYRPRVAPVRRSRAHPSGVALSLEREPNRRKATGTFYTPRAIAGYLVSRTLAPLVRDAPPERILALKVLDPSMGSGAFLVAACGSLAHAYEAALVESGGCHPRDFGPRERTAIRRTIAERCLFGVDLNPTAVQLARLSLWLTTLASDRPLSFLDHHLVVGDSVKGAWLTSLRAAPRCLRRVGSASLPLFGEEPFADMVRGALPIRFSLASTPNDTAEDVHAKERALAALNRRDGELSRWKRVADAWCAAWFARDRDALLPASSYGALADALLAGRGALPDHVAARAVAAVDAVAARHRFFHWELEFPEVFFDADGSRRPDGGFDAVVGNPPWDMIRNDAGPRADAAEADARDEVRFTRDSGTYLHQSPGHANRYQLFLERAISLTRAGGRFGLVLPHGLASDHGNGPLRRVLFSRCNVDAWVGLENSARIFPVHRSVRFLLVTATAGQPTAEFGCRLGERDTSILETDSSGDGTWFPVRLTPALLERLSGRDMAVPDLRSIVDLAIVERAHALFPRLGDAAGWSVQFGRELNATDDREHLRPAGTGWPVLEGKAIEPFRVRLDKASTAIAPAAAERLLGGRCARPRLAYRDVASATNRVTLIAALLPPRTASTHTIFCLRTPVPVAAQYFLCGLFNSLVVNYLARLRVTTHVTTAIVESLPIPPATDRPELSRDIAALARLLARRPDNARSARLNALVARLYQLTRDEFAHVLATFPLVPRDERDLALSMFG